MLPYLIHIGHLSLPTFGALAAFGLMLALWLSQLTAPRAGVNAQQLWDAGVVAVTAAFLLSRLLLVAAHWSSFRAFPALLLAVPSLTASGLLLTTVLTCCWLRWKRISVPRALDAWASGGTLVWAFLALGHLAEGSDPGMASPWGLRMPGDTVHTQPVALYASVVALLITWAAYRCLMPERRPGIVSGCTLAAVGVSQFFLSFMRLPGTSPAGSLDLLQWVALGLMAAGAALLFLMKGEGSRNSTQ